MKIHIDLIHHSINPPPIPAEDRETGAQLEFRGIVREIEDGKAIAGLNYEAYEPMARAMLERILNELSAEYSCDEVCLMHRLSFVPVGETALFARVRSRHRKAALHLMDALIDRVKKDVPIWKMV